MEDVLVSNMGCYPAVLQKKLEQLKQGIQSNKESIGQLNTNNSAIIPIAFRQSTSIEPAVRGLQTMETDFATIKYATNVKVQVADRGLIDLQNGEVLVIANKDTVLNASPNKVLVKKGGLALVAREGGNLTVQGYGHPVVAFKSMPMVVY